MNSQIRAIVFDVGGVLIRTTDHSPRRSWERRLGLESGEAEAIVLNSEMGHRAQRGKITTVELWAWVNDHLALGENLADFRRDFWAGDTLDEPLLQLVKLLNRDYQLAIISNATDSLLQTLESYDLTEEFDLIVGSAYEGIMKPDPGIYERTLARLGREADETVFIDDSQNNVAGAAAVGMHAVLFTSTEELIEALAELGVNIPSN